MWKGIMYFYLALIVVFGFAALVAGGETAYNLGYAVGYLGSLMTFIGLPICTIIHFATARRRKQAQSKES